MGILLLPRRQKYQNKFKENGHNSVVIRAPSMEELKYDS